MAVRTRAELNSDADSSLADNSVGAISPADVRGRVKDLADSALLAEDVGTAAAADTGDFATAAQGGLADTAVQPADLGDSAALDVGTTAGTVAAGDDSRIAGAIQTGSRTAVSVIGRSANSSGNAADIAAGANDRILARVSDTISWVQLTIGMIPDSLITFAKMATGAVATFGEFNTATASKMLSTASVWASPVSLTDGSTISINLNNGYDFTVTLGGNRTLGAPSNIRHGKKGIIWVSASGSTRTLTLNGAWVMEADAEEGPYDVTTSERLGICYACDNTTARVTGILRF